VGDAGAFIDPMWSSGVALALLSGLRAGLCIDALASGRLAEDDAGDYYTRSFRNLLCGLDWLIKQVYRANELFPGAPFWERCRAWPRPTHTPEGFSAQLAGWGPLRYYRETLEGMGATDASGRPLLEDVESPTDRLDGFDWSAFLASRLQPAPGVKLVQAPVLINGELALGTALRLPADAGDLVLPDGLDWPVVLARLSAGAPVEAVVEPAESDDYASAMRYIHQTRTLRMLYVKGYLTEAQAV
jgi:hypothetical protein